MAGASVGGAERGREAEQNARGSGSRADCAVLTRAGPMQGARAVECDRGTLSARRGRVDGVCRWVVDDKTAEASKDQVVEAVCVAIGIGRQAQVEGR